MLFILQDRVCLGDTNQHFKPLQADCRVMKENIEYLFVSLQVQSRCGSNENILRASKFTLCVYVLARVWGLSFQRSIT